jgi:Rrf2 family protein
LDGQLIRIRIEGLGFSAKTTYALLALLELAGVQASGDRLQVGEIAARQSIPERYLEQMMSALRRAGMVRSVRGARGGYLLARAAGEISLSEVISCLEGEANRPTANAGSSELQVINSLANELSVQRDARLSRTTLADLLAERDARIASQAMYFI